MDCGDLAQVAVLLARSSAGSSLLRLLLIFAGVVLDGLLLVGLLIGDRDGLCHLRIICCLLIQAAAREMDVQDLDCCGTRVHRTQANQRKEAFQVGQPEMP